MKNIILTLSLIGCSAYGKNSCIDDLEKSYKSLRERLYKKMVFHAEGTLDIIRKDSKECAEKITISRADPEIKAEDNEAIERLKSTSEILFKNVTAPFPRYILVQHYFLSTLNLHANACQNTEKIAQTNCMIYLNLKKIPVENIQLMSNIQLIWLEYELEKIGNQKS